MDIVKELYSTAEVGPRLPAVKVMVLWGPVKAHAREGIGCVPAGLAHRM